MVFLLLQIECRSRPWLVEPAFPRFLYVRLNGIYLRKHNPLLRVLDNSTIKQLSAAQCETKARIVLSNAEGVSITACPLSDNSAQDHYVEMFSAGWHDQHNFDEPLVSRAVSIEYINPDHEDYSFTWLELVPRPPMGLVVGKQYGLHIDRPVVVLTLFL